MICKLEKAPLLRTEEIMRTVVLPCAGEAFVTKRFVLLMHQDGASSESYEPMFLLSLNLTLPSRQGLFFNLRQANEHARQEV